MPAGESNQSDGTPTDSRHDTDTNNPPQKRRRTTGNTSSRGVANLTPDQLARKRANDREAQRAIRERTKNQIDRLNQRIHELESQQPYHELQIVLREKETIHAENEDIRKRLASVLSIIQPILRAQGGLNELAEAAERTPLPVPPHAPPPHQFHPDDPRTFQDGLVPLGEGTSPPNGPAIHSPDIHGSSRHWPYPGDAPTSHMRWRPGSNPPFDQRSPLHHDVPFDERLGVDFLLEGSQRRMADGLAAPNAAPPTAVMVNPNDQQLEAHRTLPRFIPATCPLDHIMLDFLADRRARAAEGLPIKTLVGPLYPNFTALLYPDRHVESHPLSKLLTDILRTFPDICGLPEQVAVVFIMFLVMRWLIDPTPENYDRLPEWVTPRPSQLFTPHPSWIDNIPWPRLRDRIVATTPFTVFDSFFVPYTTTLSLNWPYEPRDCLLPASKVQPAISSTSSNLSVHSPYSTAVNAGSPPAPATSSGAVSTPGTASGKEDEQWLINPAFESHLRNLGNWSLGPAFRTAFPAFANAVRIKEGR